MSGRKGGWQRVALAGFMVAVVAGIVIALVTSEMSGTGAENVGGRSDSPAGTATSPVPRTSAADCPATRSNPGGANNYLPDAPPGADLGDGFVIQGLVRNAADCRPLADVRIQVWLATRTGGESDNRTSVRTDTEGRYRVETAPTVAQFGEPNIHVAFDDDGYEPVFLRNVVDLDDTSATIDLNLSPR